MKRIVIAGVAAVAACGALGMTPGAAQASSASVPTWTQQPPAAHPTARWGASMAYDAATGSVVLFGGFQPPQRPASATPGPGTAPPGPSSTRRPSPSARSGAAMAYDAATGTVVLFGGVKDSGGTLADTWTWDGTTWTQQHPATSPPARYDAAMAYDAATGTVVLFGGGGAAPACSVTPGPGTAPPGPSSTRRPARPPASARRWPTTRPPAPVGAVRRPRPGIDCLGDTWTWDGTTWTQHTRRPARPARYASMAYDAATGTAGAVRRVGGTAVLGDTWTWDGTTWTQQHPATSPSGPVRRVDGLRRGHRHRGAVRRREQQSQGPR